MISRRHRLAGALGTLAIAVAAASSGPASGQAAGKTFNLPVAPVVPVAPPPKMGRMRGHVVIAGHTVAYRGEAGETVMTDARGRPRATISSVSYLAEGAAAADRPVTFLFNGGPGAATVPLRDGVGPTRIAAGRKRGEWAYRDNPESLLDVTDLVFIDAPGTGYGRFYAEDAKRDYWGVEQDAAAFAAFIAGWLRDHRRLGSPRFLIGESYGGARAGFLAEKLAAAGLPVKGVVLVSPSTVAGDVVPSAIDKAVAALPTQAMVARAHGKGAYVGLAPEALAAMAETFATGDYARALAKGGGLAASERDEIARRLSQFTGLAAADIAADDLHIVGFGDKLLPGERLGRDDGRLHAPLAEMKKYPAPYDEPGSTLYSLTYDMTDAVAGQFRDMFGYRSPTLYVRRSQEANQYWKTVPLNRGPTSIPAMFKAQMARDRHLRIIGLAGYYDTTIPYLSSLGDYRAAGLPADRFSYHVLPAGHAVFYDPIAQRQAGVLLRRFYADTLRTGAP